MKQELTLEHRWKSFHQIVMPHLKPETIQYRELRICFFSGCIDGEHEFVYTSSIKLKQEIYCENIEEYNRALANKIKEDAKALTKSISEVKSLSS